MPLLPAGDDFIATLCVDLREHFDIDHVTVQIERGDAVCQQAPAHVV